MHLPIKIGKAALVIALVLLVPILSLWAVSARAETNATATVDRNALGPDDTLTLTVSVSSDDDVAIAQPNLPPIQDFEILNEWQSQETRSTLVTTPSGPKFQTIRSTKHNFLLQPTREGTLGIPSVEVVVEGKTFLTKPITIRVGKNLAVPPSERANSRSAPGGNIQLPPGFLDDEDADDLFSQLLRQRGFGQRGQGGGGASRTLPINPNEAFFIQVEADKTEAYVGEQITVSWYLYTRGMIRDLDTLKYPSLRGFWKEDIEIATHLNFVDEVVNGLPYKKALLASFALFPIKEGSATIDPYTAKCTVIPATDAMGGLALGKPYAFTKSSQPIKVQVKPLPVEGRPADFSGAIGDFQVSARTEEANIVSNQPFNLKIRFEGRGNAKLIEMPPFQPPEGLELYDTQKDSKFFRTGTSYKDFSVLLIPRREGEFTIPPITVSMFDPAQRKYITKSTELLRVLVRQGSGPQAGGNSMAADGKKAAQAVDLAPKLLTEYTRPWTMTPAERSVGFTVIFLFMGASLFFRARTQLGWGQKKKDLVRKLRARLRRVEAKGSQGDWRGVGVEMTNTVYFVLGEISGEGGAHVELEKLLAKAPPSVRREIAMPLMKQMEIFNVLSFAPESVVGDLKNADNLQRAVNEMQKLMEKAVALGVSSGRGDESEEDPRAF
ncbi:MAG: BatD family protein [Bdellovibrionota bacterium]